MAKHAQLSASNSKRWMNCPGSIAAEALNLNDRKASIFAQEGTAAHLLCEAYTRNDQEPKTFLHETIYIWQDEAYFRSGFNLKVGTTVTKIIPDAEFVVDIPMIEAIEVFVTAVNVARSRLDSRGFNEYSERWLGELEKIHPLLGGTADYVAVEAFGWAELIDYKHGRGITVEVYDNTQLKIYGLGVLLEFPDCEGIRITVVQPRKSHTDGPVRSIEYTREELMDFKAELIIAAEVTQHKNAVLAAGDWCTFCQAKAYINENGDFIECPALIDIMQEEAKSDFSDDPPEIGLPVPKGTNNLAQAAKWLPVFDNYVKAVQGAIQHELLCGRIVEGKKLVRKRANRAFGTYVNEVDELTDTDTGYWDKMSDQDVINIMESELGLSRQECYSPAKIKSPAQFEAMGKHVKKLVGEMAYKPEGALIVADDTDPRPKIEVAPTWASDFPDDLK